MNDIDKYFAEQCGITLDNIHGLNFYQLDFSDGAVPQIWTIEDPRCREIVRERFNIQTQQLSKSMNYFSFQTNKYSDREFKYYITIAEAEIACITAIYDKESK